MKKRKCKYCKEKFDVKSNNHWLCSLDCFIEYDKEVKAKKWKKEKAKRKKDLMTLSDWLRDTQKIVNKYIRERDRDVLDCISCGKVINGVRHASHFMSSGGHSNIRFNTDNIWVSCYKCNVMLSGNQLPYRVRLIEKIGLERVEQLESIANETKKYSIDELKEIQKEFKEKIKSLKK